jgi:SpoVK/Ycf46/Vps4 family AAA+-type ATPase
MGSNTTALAAANEASPFTDDVDYVQAELAWVEARATRIAAERKLERMEEVGRPGRGRRSPQGWDDDESPRMVHARAHRSVERERAQREQLDARLTAHRASNREPLALDELCDRCGLDDFDRTILLLAVGPCFSRSFDEAYGHLAEEVGEYLSVEAAFMFAELDLAERLDRRRAFSPRGAMVAQDLVAVGMRHRYSSAKELLGAEIEVAGRTFAYLVGRRELHDEFLDFSSVEEPRARLEQVVIDPSDKRRILSVVERHDEYLRRRAEWGFDELIRYGRGSLMLFHGPPGTGKTMMAHGIAAHLGKRVLNVDIPTFTENSEAGRFLPGLFREARLQDAILFFDECEALFASRRRHGNALMTLLLTELERFEGVAVLATNLPGELDEALARRILVRVRFPEPDRAARADIWRQHLPDAAPLADDVDVERLAERFELSGGYIKNTVLAAVAAAVHEAGESEPRIELRHLEEAAAAQLPRVDERGEPLEVPPIRLSNVVLAPAQAGQVDQLLAAVRGRPEAMRQLGVGGPRRDQTGVAALFHGPPGTGKTLCAEALAGELNRPLAVARATSMLSKWIGQTERNLQGLFEQAGTQRAVVLIDEADSLLAPRDAPGTARHDVSMVNALLDLVERYPGLVVLATNAPDRLDAALERRIDHRIAFEPPGRSERERLWRLMLGEAAGEDIDVAALARVDVSGAAIRSAVLRAAVSAGGLSTMTLRRALGRA